MNIGNHFGYALRSAWQNFFRNATVSIAAVLVMTLLLMVMGLLFSVTHAVTQVSDFYKGKLDNLSLFLQDNVALSSIYEMKYRMESDSRVHSVQFISKEAALRKFSNQPGTAAILKDIEGNPLPASIEVTAFKPGDLEQLDRTAKGWRTLDKENPTGFQKDKVNRILSFFTVMDVALLAIILALTVVSVFIIMSTIRTAVYVRRAEIEIMKLVGATDWFVRLPFVLEGMLGGLVAATIAAVVIQVNRPLLDKVQAQIPYIPLTYDPSFQATLLLSLFGAGLGLGALGSIIGLRRFLRV